MGAGPPAQEETPMTSKKPRQRRKKAAPSRCSVVDTAGRCDRPVAVVEKALCAAHYKRLQRTGAVGPANLGEWRRLPLPPGARNGITPGAQCQVRGCPEPVVYPRARYCRGHYARYRVKVRLRHLRPGEVKLRPIQHRVKPRRSTRPLKIKKLKLRARRQVA